ncbi:MAG: chemotaxis protein CheW [Armatimonadota bacterium]|nr:MAG: chemotaxis protein CheW [Armatimonadota bacterium]
MLDRAAGGSLDLARPPSRAHGTGDVRRPLAASVGEAEEEAVADRLRAPIDVVFFRAGQVLFAVLAENVEQVQRSRGGHLPVVDLAAEIGREAQRDVVLVLRVGAARVRVRIDEALDVVAAPLENFHPLPRLAAAAQRGGYVEGIVVREDELAILLDARALARTEQEARAGAGASDAAR